MHRPESPNKRTAIRLSSPLEKKLIAYAAAATATGMGVLACSLPAEGKVVSTVNWIQILPRSMANLDLNNDGIIDFQFSNRITRTSGGYITYGTLKILPQGQSNAIWGTGRSASALASGVTIGPSGKLQPSHSFMGREYYRNRSYSGNYRSSGQWKQTSRNFLGFKFTVNGEVHYGWARVNVVATDRGMYAAVSEYAYETIPNKSIRTGQTGGTEKNGHKLRAGSGSMKSPTPARSLGNLAAGASGSQARQKPEAGRD
jgi:hypothetical protein